MKVPLCDLSAGYAAVRGDIMAALEGVLERQQLILGENVKAFEEEVAHYCQIPYGIGVASGSDALVLALMALDLQPKEAVITTAYSFFATAGAISRLGGVPLFVDIDPNTYNIDPVNVLQVMERFRDHRPRAIIPVHLFGRCAEMTALQRIARAARMTVVEDAAQAFGATYQGAMAGTLGTIGCFSFFPSKNLGAFGDGGMCVTGDERLARRVRSLRVHGSFKKYHHEEIGINSRLDEIQACILRVKLRRLSAANFKRLTRARDYNRLFAEAGLAEEVRTPDANDDGHVFHQYVIAAKDRDALKDSLDAAGIGTAVYYPVILPRQRCYRGHPQAGQEFPNAQAAAATSLALPMYPELTTAQQEFVVERVRRFYRD